MVDLLERGLEVETDALANLKTVLPAEAANMLTSMIPEPPTRSGSFSTLEEQDSGAMATHSRSDAPTTTYYQEDVMASQVGEQCGVPW